MISTEAICEHLQKENDRLRRELAEALRQLNKSTGCRWAEVITARAELLAQGGARRTCPDCKGLGEIDHGRWSDMDRTRCDRCKGEGEIYEVKTS